MDVTLSMLLPPPTTNVNVIEDKEGNVDSDPRNAPNAEPTAPEALNSLDMMLLHKQEKRQKTLGTKLIPILLYRWVNYMSSLVVNLPAQKVWVRKEYLRDLQDGHGEFAEGVWVSI